MSPDNANEQGRSGAVPWHVRIFSRPSKGMPKPRYAITLERGLRVPMPDGTYQVADVYHPVTSDTCPTLLVRTPYGRGFPYDFMYGAIFAKQGFHVVIQSARGTGGSTGTLEPYVDEAADGQAVVAWLRRQDWFNGSLGTIGASYLGFVQWALAADPPPELRAMVVQVSADDFYGFLYPGGAIALEASLTAIAAFLSQQHGFGAFVRGMLRLALTYKRVVKQYPLLDGYQLAFGQRVPFYEEWLRHPVADDPYWEPRRAHPDLKAAPPVSLLGGWYDIVIDQTLDSYQRLRDAGRPVRLVVGSWNHTSGFNKDMPIVAGEALSWFRKYLAAPEADIKAGSTTSSKAGDKIGGEIDGGTSELPVRVHVSEVGRPGEWRDFADWPPPGAQSQQWHPRHDGTLSPEPGEGTTKFRYDPADPTPAVGGPRMGSNGHGPQRNNHLEARDDVLTFTGPRLDAPLDVIGPVSIRLRAKGSGPYYDLFARLCDVDPSGTSWDVCDGILRISDGADWASYDIPMSSTAHRFPTGHRIRLQVSGGAHPRFARNTGLADQLPTATRLAPVDIELSHAETTLSLPVAPDVRVPRRAD